MRIYKNVSIIVFFSLIFTAAAITQPYSAGQVYYGRNNYIEYHAGDLPLIFSAPHGGNLTPAEIPDRTYGTTVTDSYTKETALTVRDAVYNFTGFYPHIIISNLKRTKLDPNREIVEAAQGNVWAEQAWNEFHEFIEIAKDSVTANFGKGFYVDIHGHGHSMQRLELGYLLSRTSLSYSDAQLNTAYYINSSSIRALALEVSVDFSELLRGQKSLGALFEEKGIPAVPSWNQPNPGSTNPYFSGGYNTRRHGSKDGGSISAVQIEAYKVGLRDNQTNRMFFAQVITEVFDEYFRVFFGWDGIVTGIKESIEVVPEQFYLEQNYPNPFSAGGSSGFGGNPSTMIKYSLSKSDYTTIIIYNLVGQEIKTLINGYQSAGLYEIIWTAAGLPGGIYFCKLQSGRFSEIKKLILQK